jgi:hypothetical protein
MQTVAISVVYVIYLDQYISLFGIYNLDVLMQSGRKLGYGIYNSKKSHRDEAIPVPITVAPAEGHLVNIFTPSYPLSLTRHRAIPSNFTSFRSTE